MKLSDYKATAARKILVYGPPKSGKTEFVGGIVKGNFRNIYWADMEDGIKTLLRPDSIAKDNLDKITLVKLPDTQLMPIGIETLLKIVKGGNVKICDKHGKVMCPYCAKDSSATFVELNTSVMDHRDVLVIDSVSQLSASAMNHICKEQIQKGNDDYKPDWDDWRKQGFLLDRIFSIIQHANFNTIAISHEQLVEMEDNKKKLVPIGGTSNFSKTFAKYFDDVIYMEVINRKYKASVSVADTGSAVVGSRAGRQIKDGDTILELFK